MLNNTPYSGVKLNYNITITTEKQSRLS